MKIKKNPPRLNDYWDGWDKSPIKDINVYEDAKVKNRAIGFIWPSANIIIRPDGSK